MKSIHYLRNRLCLFFFLDWPMPRLKWSHINEDWKENQSLGTRKLLLHFRKKKKNPSLFTPHGIQSLGFHIPRRCLKIICRESWSFWGDRSKDNHRFEAGESSFNWFAVVSNKTCSKGDHRKIYFGLNFAKTQMADSATLWLIALELEGNISTYVKNAAWLAFWSRCDLPLKITLQEFSSISREVLTDHPKQQKFQVSL